MMGSEEMFTANFPINLPKLTNSDALKQFILQGFTDFFQRSFIPVL